MLYIFCGDRFAAREHARQFAAACRKKRDQAEYVHLSSPSSDRPLEELLHGQGLFEKKYIVFCDELLGDAFAAHLVENPALYHESPHMFVVFEPSLHPAREKKMVGHGARGASVC